MKDFLWKKKFLYVVLATLVSCSVAAPAVYARRGILGANEGNGGIEKGCWQNAELRGLIAIQPYSSFNWKRECSKEGRRSYCYKKTREFGKRLYAAKRRVYPEYNTPYLKWNTGSLCCRSITIYDEYRASFESVWKNECRKLSGRWYILYDEKAARKRQHNKILHVCAF